MRVVERTEHLVWLPEPERHRVQGHELPIGFGTLLSHFDLGEMWECPFFTQLPDFASGTTASASAWLLCVSPYPHQRPQIIEKQPTNPVLYWLGEAGVTTGIVRLRVLSCEVGARDA